MLREKKNQVVFVFEYTAAELEAYTKALGKVEERHVDNNAFGDLQDLYEEFSHAMKDHWLTPTFKRQR